MNHIIIIFTGKHIFYDKLLNISNSQRGIKMYDLSIILYIYTYVYTMQGIGESLNILSVSRLPPFNFY